MPGCNAIAARPAADRQESRSMRVCTAAGPAWTGVSAAAIAKTAVELDIGQQNTEDGSGLTVDAADSQLHVLFKRAQSKISA